MGKRKQEVIEGLEIGDDGLPDLRIPSGVLCFCGYANVEVWHHWYEYTKDAIVVHYRLVCQRCNGRLTRPLLLHFGVACPIVSNTRFDRHHILPSWDEQIEYIRWRQTVDYFPVQR